MRSMKGIVLSMYHRSGLFLSHLLECLITITITDFLSIVIIIDITTIEEGVLEAAGSEVSGVIIGDTIETEGTIKGMRRGLIRAIARLFNRTFYLH